MRRLLGFVLHLSVLLIFLAAVVMPSCQGRQSEQVAFGQDSTGIELAKMQRNRDSLNGILAQLREDPSLQGSDIGYMIVDCTDSLMQIIAQYEPNRTMIPASTLKLFVTGAALEILGPSVFREVMTINQLSINWRSSKLLRRIGAEVYGASNNQNGFRAILDFWTRKGLDLSGINFDDGNGLS